MYYTNEKVPIRFDDGIEVSRPWLAADETRAQRVLKNHRSERAQCLCTPYGVPMHVVCRDGRYHLATNPGHGSHHALSCPAYRPDQETTGLKHYGEGALTLAAGRHKLQVRYHPPKHQPFEHFSPSAAFQFLWEFAGLNVCTPKTVAKRSFLAVSKSLVHGSHHLRFNDRALRLFVPTAVPEIDNSRYAIGQISKIFHGQYANGVKLAAERPTTFWITEQTWQACGLDTHFGPFDAPEKAQTYWLMGKLWRSPQNNWRLFDVGALPVSDQLLPARREALPVLQKLVDNKRRFFVCQRYDAVDDDTIPLAVLIDRQEPQIVSYPLVG